MRLNRKAHGNEDRARTLLDHIDFEELGHILRSASGNPHHDSRILQRAHERHEHDTVLCQAPIPRHIYVISSILDDPGVSAGVLDRFIDLLRRHVYGQADALMAC